MLSGTFVTEVKAKNIVELPSEVVNGLQLSEGDKIEVMVKRIKTKRLDIKISKNPLIKLLNLSEEIEAR